jgi:hypothetical protein
VLNPGVLDAQLLLGNRIANLLELSEKSLIDSSTLYNTLNATVAQVLSIHSMKVTYNQTLPIQTKLYQNAPHEIVYTN